MIDAEGNEFVLRKHSDVTAPVEDDEFLEDFVIIFAACILLSIVFRVVRLVSVYSKLFHFWTKLIFHLKNKLQPPFFGYITAGILLGPLGFDVIQVKSILS